MNIFVQRKLAKDFISLKDYSEKSKESWSSSELKSIFSQIRKVYEQLKGKEGIKLELGNFFINPKDS